MGTCCHLTTTHLSIAPRIAKCGSGRSIPINPQLARGLEKLHRENARPRDGPVIASERGGSMTARGIVNWFGTAYRELGLIGCSSHSGRRTFITKAARLTDTISHVPASLQRRNRRPPVLVGARTANSYVRARRL